MSKRVYSEVLDSTIPPGFKHVEGNMVKEIIRADIHVLLKDARSFIMLMQQKGPHTLHMFCIAMKRTK